MPVTVLLAPGASGTVAGLRPYLMGLSTRGIKARGVALPRGSVERALPVWSAAIDAIAAQSVVIGGHSFGGRVASLIAADRPVAGLILMSYPLHRPGHPEQWEARTDHWPQIRCPVLLLSGEADPFARIELLRAYVARLRKAELVTYPGLGHTLKPVLEDVLDRTAHFIAALTAP